MTPFHSELHERSQRFHAEIARRASLVPQRETRSYCIPNTPFGVPKLREQPPREPRVNLMAMYYHTMWFYNLVYGSTIKVRSAISILDIQRAVANNYEISMTEMLSDRRRFQEVRPRQVAMYLSKKLTLRSLPEIGRKFAGRDHTTVLHGVRQMEALIARDEEFAARVAEITAGLSA